jgi:DNA-binding transcriptional LysR family regulator
MSMLDEIAAFVRVVEAGSFTAAAKQLGVPKSTLSRALSRLEDHTKTRLLRRTTRAIALTEAGRRFYEQVAPHVGGLGDALAGLAEREDAPRGLLRVTAPVDVGEAFLGDVITRFVARYPAVEVDVDLSGRMVDLVQEGFDVAIRASKKLKDSSLVARKIADTELALYASPSYLARRGTPASAAELEGHDLVLFRPASSTSSASSSHAGLGKLTGRVRTGDFVFARAAIRAGAGIGPLPSFLVGRELADGRLQHVLPGWSELAGPLYFVYPSARHVPKKVSAFREFVVECFRTTLGAPGGTR